MSLESMSKKFKIYRSSAGSGKTYELAINYVRLAIANASEAESWDPDSYKSILALTFTKAAAEEMKQRVLDFLRALSQLKENTLETLEGDLAVLYENLLNRIRLEDEFNVPAPEHIGLRSRITLKKILHNYSEFSIQTIDSFVNSLTRSFYRDLGINSQKEISFDEDETIEESVDRFFNDLQEGSDHEKWVFDYFKYRRSQSETWNLQRDLRNFSKDLLKNTKPETVDQISSIPLKELESEKVELLTGIKKKEKELVRLVEDTLSTIQKMGLEESDFAYGATGFVAYLKKLRINLYSQKTFGRLNGFEKGNNLFSKTASKTTQEILTSKREEIMDLMRGINDFLIENRKAYLIWKNRLQITYRLGVISVVMAKLKELKDENGILFLRDLQELIHKNVREEPVPFVFERVGQKFKHILIDEFQDTSDTQWLNLIPLISNGLSTGNESMVVGDAKQSIYGWRGGDPDLLISLPELPEEQRVPVMDLHIPALVQNAMVLQLDRNYRSAPEIVDFNNSFFDTLISENQDQIPGLIKFFDSHRQNPIKKGQGRVDLIQLNDSNEREFETLELLENRLEEALDLGYKLNDVCVLVRSNSESRRVLEELLRKGYPCVSGESLLLNGNSSIKAFMALLGHLLFPQDEFYRWELIQHLSEGQGQNELDPNWVKSAIKDDEKGFWINLNKRFSGKNDLNVLKHESVYTIFERFIRGFSLESIEGNKPFISSFLDVLFQFIKRPRSGIKDFLDFWEDKKDSLSISEADGIEGVRIMTIHKSKGLEFPVVIVPFISWSLIKYGELFQAKKLNSHGKLGIASLLNFNKGLEETDLKDDFLKHQQSRVLENINALYVAFTRASEWLIGICPPPSKKGEAGPSKVNSFIGDFFDSVNTELGEETESGISFLRYSIGSTEHKKRGKAQSKEKFRIKVTEFRKPKPWIKIKIDDEPLEEEVSQKIDRGLKVHSLFERIIDSSSLDWAKEQLNNDPYFRDNRSESVFKALDLIEKSKELKQFYSPDAQTYLEQELVLKSEILRPDRIVRNGDQWMILDYKTGKKDHNYRNQLNDYSMALRESLSLRSEPKKCLFYISDAEGVELDIWS